MWNPPIELTPEEQKIAARTRKTRKFFVFLRERRHELLDADFQHTLAESYSPEPGGKAPVDAGLLALATLLQAYCNVGDRDAVELTVMDKRWQMVLDCLGAEHPPFSRGTLFNFRMRLIEHNLDKTLLDRTVALAETTGGFGARQLRAVLDSTPLFGAGRVEDTLNLLGHALRKAVGLAAQELGTSPEALVEDAGLVLVGHSRLKAALDLDWGEPTARESALRCVLEEVARWTHWLEQQPSLLAQKPPLKEMMDTMASPRIAQWAAQGVHIIARPWPCGGPLFTKHDFTFDFAHGHVTCPNGQTVPLVPGRDAQFPARACDTCPLRTQCTTARLGHGRSLTIREDEQFQHKLRAKMKTKRGRASLRKRTAVEHAISHQLAHQGRRARYKGLRKNQFDGRRHAAVSNLQVAAHYEEERRLAS